MAKLFLTEPLACPPVASLERGLMRINKYLDIKILSPLDFLNEINKL
jgi:hypothetical protein